MPKQSRYAILRKQVCRAIPDTGGIRRKLVEHYVGYGLHTACSIVNKQPCYGHKQTTRKTRDSPLASNKQSVVSADLIP